MAALPLNAHDDWHPEWNYTMNPNPKPGS